jgi:hypothetical protein
LGAQALVWFGVAGAAVAVALSMLHARYVRKEAQAVRSGGGFALFAGFLLLFAVGAAVAGYAAARAGR